MKDTKEFSLKLINSLIKVFPDEEPREDIELNTLASLRGETVSFQVAYKKSVPDVSKFYKVKIKSALGDKVTVRQVVNVPVSFPCHNDTDDNYLRKAPGLYPDLLRSLKQDRVHAVINSWQSLWIDVNVSEDVAPGDYEIVIEFYSDDGSKKHQEIAQIVKVLSPVLPNQTLIHTEWFHSDCLAQHYDVEVFSDEHFKLIENFIKAASNRGCNMILTPHFTPPLDTAIGGERTTVQLVDVNFEDGKYSFNFDKLKRWIDICKNNGIMYFEMSHLFTQWGAKFAPKIMAEVNGEFKQIFGWDTKATSAEYTNFLHSYLPKLIEKLYEWKIAKETYFHISDEPVEKDLEAYTRAKESIADLLTDFKIIDALSDFSFYESGVIKKPICSNDLVHTFLNNKVENMWTYYCTSQKLDVSNRFMSMPSSRNRILGFQLFKYNIEGFLHWGYNFYNSFESLYPINPFEDTCAGGVFPAGDTFLVYPGENGIPEESIRIMVLNEALNDLRACQLLASKIGKSEVVELIEENLESEITFSSYPKSEYWLHSVRNKINKKLSNLE